MTRNAKAMDTGKGTPWTSGRPTKQDAWEAMYEACVNGDWEAMAEAAEEAHGDGMGGHMGGGMMGW